MIEYVWKITLPPKRPGALGEGSLTHEGLEVLTNGGTLDEAKLRIRSKAWEAVEPIPEEFRGEWIAAADNAQNYITGYVEWLESTGSDQRYVIHAAEEEISMPLIEIADRDTGEIVTWVLRGKLDRRMFDRFTERHLFMDYKTTARFEDILEAAYRNEQFPTYELLMRHKYPEERCGSGVWRMLRKVKRAKDGDGDFFMDYQASYNDDVVEAMRRRYMIMAGEMHNLEQFILRTEGETMLAYPSPDFRCSWDCPYKHECPMFDDGSRVREALRDQYVEFDPYARYNELKGDMNG
jgi:hypothetical protein